MVKKVILRNNVFSYLSNNIRFRTNKLHEQIPISKSLSNLAVSIYSLMKVTMLHDNFIHLAFYFYQTIYI